MVRCRRKTLPVERSISCSCSDAGKKSTVNADRSRFSDVSGVGYGGCVLREVYSAAVAPPA